MVGATKHRTQADDTRFEIIAEIGCLACAIEGWPGVPCQAHHLLESTSRYDDQHRYTLGLCPWHHAGDVPPAYGGCVSLATSAHGPSLHHASRAFYEHFGTDEELLAIQDSMIRMIESARRRGEYLPDTEIMRLVRMLFREVVHHRSPNPKVVCGCG